MRDEPENVGPRTQDYAMAYVIAERGRQDRKWGVQYHNVVEWLTILSEEVGELAQECLRAHFGNVVSPNLRAEAVQVAAVALAFIEAMDEKRLTR